jgi:hypothetical protein
MTIDSQIPQKSNGLVPESWLCVDCGLNTAPGLFNRAALEQAFTAAADDAGVDQSITWQSEVYMVRDRVWQRAGMQPFGGCLCIACLKKRIGRRLRPKDFPRKHPFNTVPAGSPRLLNRRGRVRV